MRTDATRTMDYRLARRVGRRHRARPGRPVPVRPDPRRGRPAPGQRGSARAAVDRARRPRARATTGRWATCVGVSFAVWAPRAKAVRVIGDFNDWDGRIHPMRLPRRLAGSGSCSSPTSGSARLQVRDPRRRRRRAHQGRPDGAAHRDARRTPARSSTSPATSGRDDDVDGPSARGRDPHNGPMSVYEVHLGSWRQGLSLPRPGRAPRQLRHATSASPTSSCSR